MCLGTLQGENMIWEHSTHEGIVPSCQQGEGSQQMVDVSLGYQHKNILAFLSLKWLNYEFVLLKPVWNRDVRKKSVQKKFTSTIPVPKHRTQKVMWKYFSFHITFYLLITT